MKKLYIITILSVFTCSALFAQSNNESKATSIIEKVSDKYQSFASFKVTFSNELKNVKESIKEEFSGEIYVRKDKYKLILDEQEIYNNGTTIWTYLKEVNEVNIDTHNPDSEDLNLTKIFSIYTQGYKSKKLPDKTEQNKHYWTIELTPDESIHKNPPLEKIIFQIDKNTLYITHWEIYDNSNNVYSYHIKSFTPNIILSDSFFEFDESKHAGVEVIDLR